MPSLQGLAWSPDSRTIYVKVATGVMAAAAPPASPSVTALEGAGARTQRTRRSRCWWVIRSPAR